MSLKTALFAGIGLMVLAAPASAQPKIYPYHASANYCPAGLQPIQIDGVICCGTPNQSISYSQMNAHPVAKKKKVYRKAVKRSYVNCPVGEKGCYTR